MSSLHPMRGIGVLAGLMCLVGCEAAKSANPVAPSSTIAEVVAVSPAPVAAPARISAPVAMAPAGRLNTNNPDFFVVNGEVEGGGDVTYMFEVSRTADFSQLVAVVSVPASYTGNTMMSLGSLAYGGTFFWRAKAVGIASESEFSNALSFTLPSGPNAPSSGDPVASIAPAYWSTDEWRTFFYGLAERKGVATVSNEGMHAMRADLVAHGADFQNGWRGDLRPRLFLPVPGCPVATRPDVPECSYSRTVDLGNYGQEWRWWVR
jgi:hypothetical protein